MYLSIYVILSRKRWSYCDSGKTIKHTHSAAQYKTCWNETHLQVSISPKGLRITKPYTSWSPRPGTEKRTNNKVKMRIWLELGRWAIKLTQIFMTSKMAWWFGFDLNPLMTIVPLLEHDLYVINAHIHFIAWTQFWFVW